MDTFFDFLLFAGSFAMIGVGAQYNINELIIAGVLTYVFQGVIFELS